MESENGEKAEVPPAKPLENEENLAPQPVIESYVAQVSSITDEKTAENTSEQVQSQNELEASTLADAGVHTPLAGRSHDELISVNQNGEEASEATMDPGEDGSLSIDSEEFSDFLDQEAEEAEMLTIENLEKITKKNLKKQKQQEKPTKTQLREKKKQKRALKIGTLLADIPSDSEDESSISSDEDSRSDISVVSFKFNFLSKLGSLPRLSQISLDREEESLVASIRVTQDPEVIDPDLKGRFVNSLTGETESTETTETTEEIEEESAEFESEDSSSDFDLLSEREDEEPTLPEKQDEENFFFEEAEVLAESGRATFILETESFIKARDLKNRVISITMDFLEKLFDSVVDTVNSKTLAEKLDKMKLFKELEAGVVDYRVEKSCNTFLDNKAVECHRRMRRGYAYAKLRDNEEVFEYHRYKRALNFLDHIKQRAVEAKKKCNNMTTKVNVELVEGTVGYISLSDRIEKRIREVLMHKDSEIIMKAIAVDMQTMRHLQNKISESREILISRNHTLASLIERALEVANITENLTTNEFLSVERQVLLLSKRINERDDRFKVIQERCNNELKRGVYYQEKRNFDLSALAAKKEILDDLCAKKEELWKHLYELRMQHIQYINQKHELNLRAGILYKPALMLDFDKTVELVNEKRKIVDGLRTTFKKLQRRLSALSTNSSHFDLITGRKVWIR
ncbi:uncharacterized protein LOC6641600 [Drosophila willistoni]|uniref:uncharacterized protein LOC6641600 n=1 Tax=Drosophila willistoni TaxID=7260 RepID=UPI000C26D4C0|nr:uncharacterized protein LOC6641600 [Drosophila willistoni]